MTHDRWTVPDSWAWAAVADIGKVTGGGTPSARDPTNFADVGIPWITPADLTGYSEPYIGRGRRDLSDKGYASCGATLMPSGTVLFSSRAPVGYCAIASDEITTNQGFKSVILADGVVPEYLRHYLLASKDYAESLASGTTFLELSGARFADLTVPLPPLSEQRRIVAKLDVLTARTARARAALDRVPDIAALYRKAVLSAAFRGELTSGRRGEKSTDGVSHDPAGLFTTPRGWGWHPAGSVVEEGADIVYGIIQPGPKLSEGVPYVRGTDIQGGKILMGQLLKTSPEIASRYHRSKLKGGDVLLGIIRATKVAVVPDELEGANITQGTARFRPGPSITTEFLAHWLEGPDAQGWLHRHYRGIDMPGLNLGDVRRLPVPVPPLPEQAEIVRVMRSALAEIDRLMSEAAAARRLLDRLDKAILAKAFRGELVPQDRGDEPASVLLERIRAQRAAAPKSKRKRTGRTGNNEVEAA